MAYHMHEHLREIKEFLEADGREVGKNGRQLYKRLSDKQTTLLITHDDMYCEVVLQPINFTPGSPDVEMRISCREFAYERLQIFDKRCAQLKSWLRILGTLTPAPSRSRRYGGRSGSLKSQ